MPRPPTKKRGKKLTVAPPPPVVEPPSTAEVLLARFMDIHWGLSLAKRKEIAERMAELAVDQSEEVGPAVNVMAAKTVSEFDKINLGAAKLAFDTILASQAARVERGDEQLSEDQYAELVGTLAADGPPAVVADQVPPRDEDGPGVGEPSIFDEVARQMAGRTAG